MDKLSVKDYVELLSQRLPDLSEKTLQQLKDEGINGRRARALNTSDFHSMGIRYGDAKDIIEFNQTFNFESVESQSKQHDSSKPGLSAQSSQSISDVEPKAGPSKLCTSSDTSKSKCEDQQSSLLHASSSSEDSDKDFSELSPYFDLDKLSHYEKKVYLNQKRNYESGLAAGEFRPMPFFLSRRAVVRNRKVGSGEIVQDSHGNGKHEKSKPSSSKSQKVKQSKEKDFSSFSSDQEKNSNGEGDEEQEDDSEKTDSECDRSKTPRGSGMAAGSSKESRLTQKSLSSSADSSEPSKKKRKTKKRSRRQRSKVQLSEEEYAATLPKYDIDKILKDAGDELEEALSILGKDGICFGPERKRVIRTLANHLYFKEVSDPLHVTVKMREGMACSFVNKYPLYKSNEDQNKRSWWRIFDPSKPAGYLQNAVKTIFNHIPQNKRPRGGGKKKKGGNHSNSDDSSDQNQSLGNSSHDPDQEWMSLEMALECNKKKITEGMRRSREVRRKWITSEGPYIAVVLKRYPHLMSFDGELIELDFEFMYPNHVSTFMKEFPSFIRGLRAVEKENFMPFEEITGDDGEVISACLTIAKLLPRPNLPRSKKGKTGGTEPLRPDVSSLVTIIPENTNVKDEIKARRTAAKGKPVQPYLLGLAPGQDFTSLCIVLDDKCIMLGKVTLIKAFDMLFKVYHVFNAHYPAGWKTFWEFIEFGIYSITPQKLTNKGKEILQKVKLYQGK
ncbi:Protein GrpE [Frankliniella fusca]|uniref:Protein GrpE n=1 Tax=Frankliniella fusca TaxID=407009 RepID=A0AAE1I0P7_9NEOP|nr:Protein GrpE [Frankliniella fusca]